MSGFSFTEPMGIDIENIYSNFIEVFQKLIIELNLFVQEANTTTSLKWNQETVNKIYMIDSRRDFLSKSCENYFTENKKYLLYIIVGKNFLSYMQEVIKSINQKSIEITPDDVNNVLNSIQELFQAFNTITSIAENEKASRKLISDLEEQVEKATISVQNIESAKLALETNETDKIYKDLSGKYEEEYELNNEYFRNSLIITVCCTFLSIAYTFNIPIDQINWPVFISVKLLIIAVGITLCTLFLRRSAHAKKLYEKAYQTHVEINAYPIFIKSLKEEDQQEITKELALRYFGNDIDQTQNDKIGDLMQDQLTAGTELIKASAEMVKAKNGSSSS